MRGRFNEGQITLSGPNRKRNQEGSECEAARIEGKPVRGMILEGENAICLEMQRKGLEEGGLSDQKKERTFLREGKKVLLVRSRVVLLYP